MDIFDQITEGKEGDIFDQIAKDKGDIFDTIKPDKPIRKPAKIMGEEMMSQIVGLERQPDPGIPFAAKHPSIYAAGKTVLAMPGLVEEAAMSVVSGATFSLPERAKEAGEWLSQKLFGEKPEGSWIEDEPVLPSYVEKGARIAGSFITIGTAGKAIAAPIIGAVTKHKHLAPFARMIGWGVAGTTYGGAEKMIAEGELPTPKELVKEGTAWAAIEGAISSLGWTGRLAMGINRLSKLWTIPKKEVLKAVIKEAKAKNMPIAKYAYTKAKVQKALSKKEVDSAKELLDMVDDIPKQFKKKGTYADLTKQLETEGIEGRIKSFEKHVGKAIPKPTKAAKIPIKAKKAMPTEGWRADTGYKHPKGATAASVVRYEQEELGNKLGVSIEKIKELKNYPASKIKWVATTKEGAQKYGDPKKIPLGKNIEVVASDGEGGLLVLDKTLEAIKAKGAALKLEDGTIITGQTHAVAYQKALKKGLEAKLDKGFGEGFVTTSGKYITRDEAQTLYKASETNALLKKGVIATGKKEIFIQKSQRNIFELRVRDKLNLTGKQLKEFISVNRFEIDKAIRRGIKNRTITEEADRFIEGVKAIEKPTPKPSTTIGFGPTSQLQNIYEKLMGSLKHKPLKKKLGDVAPRKQSSAANAVMDALKKIKPFTEKQRATYEVERGRKLGKAIKLRGITSGEKGYYAELKALRGKMKIEGIQFEPIRKAITQKEANALMNEVRDCPVLSNWETYPARKALAQLFDGVLPTPSGQAYLKDVFGKKFVDAMLTNRGTWEKIKKAGIMAINFPKAIKSSYDLSAPLRQGVFMVKRYRQWIPAFRDMFKYFGSKEAYHEGMLSIRRHQNYKLSKDHGLALTDLGNITSREEAFMSPWAEKIPGVGASSQAYTGFLNDFRFSVFNEFVKKGKRLGLLDNPKYLKTAAKYINHATGRGHLLGFEGAATELNTVFFSPRLIMSRLQLINPVFYVKLQKNVRKEALKDLAGFASIALTVGGLAKKAGLSVEVDPRSADFMKVRVGNKRYDILGGFQQPIRAMAQIIMGEIKSSTTGETLTLGEGYRAPTRLGVAGKCLQYKLSPASSFGVALLTGQATMGGKLDIPTEIGKLFAPMVASDMVEIYNDEGLKGLPLATPAVFGVGLQTYGGTSTYGLAGRHYKTLNTELTQLKTSMGFPSTSVYGQPLTNAEYKKFKDRAGKEIAKSLETIMKISFYKKADDNAKRHILDKVIDHTKEDVKRRMFKRYKLVQEQAASIRKATYKPVHESRKLAEEQLAHILEGR